jgi:hypothetical protein
MALIAVEIELSFSGRNADHAEIDFYDVTEALRGFHRSLALTTQLVLTGKVSTRTTAFEDAQIFARPPEQGSWTVEVIVGVGTLAAGGLYHFGTAPRDTPLGNLISSAYDYLISKSLGFHVDYSKTLGQQLEELRGGTVPPQGAVPPQGLTQPKLDAVAEKCGDAIKSMHSPIVRSETAEKAELTATIEGSSRLIGRPLTRESFDYLTIATRENERRDIVVRVSSYNMDTYYGRAHIPGEARPISFTLASSARWPQSVALITESLRLSATDPRDPAAGITFTAVRETTRSGRLKRLMVVRVSK